MLGLQKSFNKEIKNVHRRLLEDHLKKKLREVGAPSSREVISKLSEHVLSGRDEAFVWGDSRDPSRFEISITSEDIKILDRKAHDFAAKIPDLVEGLAHKSADDILEALKKDWPEQSAWEESVLAVFEGSLEARWGKGLNLLRMLVTICREIGAETVKRQKRSNRRKHSHLNDVLLRLHARACQVSNEIITLLESGYADGAMARWRTLYEIGVVAIVIADHGEEIAERYVDHQIVESKTAMEQYSRSSVLLGFKAVSQRQSARILKGYKNVIFRWGKEFGSAYGWAALHLNLPRPTFADLEAAAGSAHMRSHYKMASYNVHAGAKGIFFRLTQLGPQEVILAGPSNAGLTDPAQNTAITLTSVTSLLFAKKWTLDNVVQMLVLAKLRDEIPHTFWQADVKLRRDDARYRAGKDGRRSRRK
jgi:hypothetical protein